MADKKIQIPNKAADGDDLAAPIRGVLEEVNLLGTLEDTKKAGEGMSALIGPPQSVALIEAGVTAGAKWWSAGLGAATLGAWASVSHWWPHQSEPLQVAVIASAAAVTAAAILGIAYLLASDVRGRAAAAVATINARAEVARSMIGATQELVGKPAAPSPATSLIPVGPVSVRRIDVKASDESGWRVLAMSGQGEKFLLVKSGAAPVVVAAEHVDFTP